MSPPSLGVAMLGCGLIGGKRGRALGELPLVGVFDPDASRARRLAEELGTLAYPTEDALFSDPSSSIVVIATPNRWLCGLAARAVEAGKHVLVEKPAAIRLADIRGLAAKAARAGRAVKVGFNHRFHPAIAKARELVEQDALGELMFLRARYGHGGRLGYEKEWRADAETSGGGELIDQGIHLLDLIHWFLGPLPLQSAFVTTSFWPMKVDDNAVLTVAGQGRWATFHVSCSEWKNTFSLELYGRTGKALIQGLGGSYGKETLTYYRMLPAMGPPETQVFEFDGPDRSWELDMANLVGHVREGKPLSGDLASAEYALAQVAEAYRRNGFGHLPCSA